MSVLLPSATVRILSPQRSLDAHGGDLTYGWTSRGPYPAHIGSAGQAEDVPEKRRTTGWTATLDPAAWPVSHLDRILVDGTGQILEVTGARLVADLAGAGIGHVSAACVEIAEATLA